MVDEEGTYLEDLKRAHQNRLKVLELKAAEYGMNTPAEVQIEIHEIKRKLESLEPQSKQGTSDPEEFIPSLSFSTRPLALIQVSLGKGNSQYYFILENHRSIVMGRAPSCDIRIESPNISRVHCKIKVRKSEITPDTQRYYYVEMLQLSNHPILINDKLTTVMVGTRLNHGDIIQIGEAIIKFYQIDNDVVISS